MIDQVNINNNLGDTLTIKLRETNPKHGLFLTGIDGIGTVKSDIRMSKNATTHGAIYNSSRANTRDITFHFLYVDGYTNNKYISAEEARINTYKYFPLGEKVTLTFYTDYYSDKEERRIARVVGYVVSNDPDIFTDPYSGTSITVSCPSSWMYIPGDTGLQIETFSNFESMFEFPEISYSGDYDAILNDPEYGVLEFEPLSTDVIQKDDATPKKGGTREFTAIHINENHNIYYRGEVETGMLITIAGNGYYTFPTIYNIDTGESLSIDTDIIEKMMNPNYNPNVETDHTIGDGDEIRISTNPNDKYVKYYKDGGATILNIINAINIKTFDWLTLRPGDNTFAYTCATGNLNVDITIQARVYLEGV